MNFRLMNAKDVPDRAEKSPAHIVFAARKKGEACRRQEKQRFEKTLFDIYTKAVRIASTRPDLIIEVHTGQPVEQINWPQFIWKDDHAEIIDSDNPRVNAFVRRHACRLWYRGDAPDIPVFSTWKYLSEHFESSWEVCHG